MEVAAIIAWMAHFNDKIQANKEYLSELDTPIGDGDHGGNMARGMKAVQEALASTPPTDVRAAFKTIAMQLISQIGGASGLLYGSAFLAVANAYQDEMAPETWLQIGLDAIQKRGKAAVGEKTLVDVWHVLIKEVAAKTMTRDSIQAAMIINKDIQATKGRASYVGERSIGHIDPGSYSSGLLFEAMLETGVYQ